MSNPITVTCAPCCWGVDDVSNPHLPPWERVLDEAAQAGFGGLELGPYGYMPLDSARVGAALEARGLRIVAGTIFDDLVNPGNRENLLRQTDEICALITALPRPETHSGQRFQAPYLTVMDWGHDERDYAAGHSDRAPRLDADSWAGMVANIRAIAELARDRHGVRAVIHPHAGGYIEFEDELDRIANDVPSETAGLCLDTGHLDYAGMDPVETLRRYADRTDYIHFKDIDAAKYADVMSRRIRFFDACAFAPGLPNAADMSLSTDLGRIAGLVHDAVPSRLDRAGLAEGVRRHGVARRQADRIHRGERGVGGRASA